MNLLRATKVEIDTAKIGGDNWVRAPIQVIEADGKFNVLSERVADHTVFRNVRSVAHQKFKFKDPYTGKMIEMSTLQISYAIKAAVLQWIQEDFDTTLIEELGVAILNDD